jgi:hypothetical protein
MSIVILPSVVIQLNPVYYVGKFHIQIVSKENNTTTYHYAQSIEDIIECLHQTYSQNSHFSQNFNLIQPIPK